MNAMKYLNEYPKKQYTQAANRSDIEQKTTKCGIGLGKCFCELADELRKNGMTPEPVSDRVSELMGIPRESVESLGRIYRWYRSPAVARYPVFELYYLYRIELAVLEAFIPVLRRHLDRVRKGLDSNVWLTKHSIEIQLDSKGGGKAWYDLKELPSETVIALGATIKSPASSTVASQVKPPVAPLPQIAPVAISQVEVSPASMVTVVTEVAMETLVPSDSTSFDADFESGGMNAFEDSAADFFDNIDWDNAFA